MLSSRLDFIYLFDKRTATATATPAHARTNDQPTHAQPFRFLLCLRLAFQHVHASPTRSSPFSLRFAVARLPSRLLTTTTSRQPSPPSSAHPTSSCALRDTLSDYHVLAGRLTINSYAQQCIRLTDDGVAWINATAPATLTVDSLLPALAHSATTAGRTRATRTRCSAPLPAVSQSTSHPTAANTTHGAGLRWRGAGCERLRRCDGRQGVVCVH